MLACSEKKENFELKGKGKGLERLFCFLKSKSYYNGTMILKKNI